MNPASTLALAAFSLLSSASTEPRDPYQSPFDAVEAAEPGRTLLERVPLEELRLTGVVLTQGRSALLEDKGGRGHVVRVGTAVGTAGGRVFAILPDRILVEELRRDAIGVVRRSTVALPLATLERAR